MDPMTQHTIIRSRPFYKGVTKELTSPTRSDNRLTYAEGTVVTADGIDLDPEKDCGQGINFCRSIAEALRWGPVVVEIRIPAKVQVVDTGTKLRAKKVEVGPVVSLSGADLSGAHLYRANLSGAHLYGANLSGANLYGADLYETRGDRYTTLPSGYSLTEAGLIVRSS